MVCIEQLLVDPQGNKLEDEELGSTEDEEEEEEELELLSLEQPSSQELQMQLLVGPAGQRINPHSQHSEEEDEEELEELELEVELRGRINSQWGLQGLRAMGLHPLDEDEEEEESEDDSEEEDEEEEEDSLAGLTGLR